MLPCIFRILDGSTYSSLNRFQNVRVADWSSSFILCTLIGWVTGKGSMEWHVVLWLQYTVYIGWYSHILSTSSKLSPILLNSIVMFMVKFLHYKVQQLLLRLFIILKICEGCLSEASALPASRCHQGKHVDKIEENKGETNVTSVHYFINEKLVS